MEQLGTGLKTEESRGLFYNDFILMENIVREKNKIHLINSTNSFLPSSPLDTGTVLENEDLYDQQLQLSFILETSTSYGDAVHLLKHSSLAHSDWNIENWEPYMIETAMKIAQKWKK
jgi:hypothetical protein